MDHRYNPDFIKFVAKQARWSVRHQSCLDSLCQKRSGDHACASCGKRPVLVKRAALLSVGGVEVPIVAMKTARGTSLGYLCPCGVPQQCACPTVSLNFSARLVDKLRSVGASSVAKADATVDTMSDGDAALYGTLRDTFLKDQMIKTRSVERVRKAAADERTSQGGEVVYFVSSDDGKVKIGTSANVEKRMTALQTSASTKLTLLLTIPGSTDMESDLHRRFSHLRESGEWFVYSDEIRHFVEGAAYYKQLAHEPAKATSTTPE